MALLTLSSLGHSPGTSTTAVAMALRWPRAALLIEADTSRTSAVLAGRFRGQIPHRMGLTTLASAALHNELSPALVWANSLELTTDRRVVPGFSTMGAARGAAAFWSELTNVATGLEADDTDVLIDLGRCDATDPRIRLLVSAQLKLLVTGTTLPDIAATTAPVDGRTTRLDELTALMRDTAHPDALRLVLVERAHENYSAAEIRRVTRVPVLGALPFAPEHAAHVSLGRPQRRRGDAHAYDRSIDQLVAGAMQLLDTQRARIGLPPAAAASAHPEGSEVAS